ncbi:hypothetical protein Pme01_54580 [Planosporangium mesophilum]|uniref:Fibronectin type-III domain-containing protein n=1 Tax=Planosporangium mesophilum TaxID=689768 RepID=A0A8J3THS1_9ACTN|nr:hypothetical protein Pme01_54580 [Planosporangium mesophilum]
MEFTSATPGVCEVAVPVTGKVGVTTANTTADVTLLQRGTCTINADQPGDDMVYLPAERVVRSFEVLGVAQTINFPQPPDAALAAGTTTVAATASSGMPVTYTSATPAVCTVPAPVLNAAAASPVAAVTLRGAGVCTIHADQTGSDTYLPAPRVSRSFNVTVPAAPVPNPGDITATAGVSSITVSWQAPDVDGVTITGYTAVANPGPATCTTTDATTCVLGATAGVKYTVTVIAHTDGDGDLESDPSNEVTPIAPPVPTEPPATSLVLTTDKGQITTATQGQEITFIGTGFAAHSTVTITMYSTPTSLGSVVTDASGAFSKAVTIPTNLATGTHTAVAQGVAPDGTARAMALAITVAAPSSALPVTGVALTTLVLFAVALTAGGVVLVRLGRRRRVAGTESAA